MQIANRVLIVEDDFVVRKSLRRMLEAEGYSVIGDTASGKDTVAMTAELRPDVVIMDLKLLDLDGLTAAQRIADQCPTPIVALTAYKNPELVAKASEVGVGYYLVKPVRRQELARAIQITTARFEDWRQVHRLNQRLETEIAERKQMEAALQETTARYDKLVATVPIGVYIAWLRADNNLEFEYVSERWCEIHQVTEEAVLSDASIVANDQVHPEERAQFLARNQEAQRNHKPFLWEGRFVIGGEIRWLRLESTPTVMDNGDTRWFGVTQDITARKQANDALRRSEARYRLLAENSTDVIWTLDNDYRFTYISPSIFQLRGLTPEEAMRESIWDTMPPHSLEIIQQAIRQRAAAEAAGRFDTIHRLEIEQYHRNGDLIWVEIVTQSLLDEQGRRIGYLGVSRDIAARKQMEGALRESAERLKLALRGGALGTWDWNVQTDEMYFDARWAEMLGYRLEEIAPYLNSWKDLIHPDDLPGATEKLTAHLEGRAPFYEAEFRMHHKSGEWVWILNRGEVIQRDEEGRPLRACGTHLDITEHKWAEERLEHYAAELERSNRDLEQFGYIISHDLQAPARMVESFLQLLKERYGDQLEPKAKTYIDYAMEGAEQMQEMIDALLDLARVENQGKEPAPTDAEAVLQRVLGVLSQAIGKTGAEVTHDSLPTVMADETQLAQVFQNLISNGIKFCREECPPHVHVSVKRKDDMWLFSVADNGIGIDPGQIDRVFQIFQRLHTREEYEGTGIGLALCKRIIERHGGKIWLSSEPGVGSTFLFTLPGIQEGA